MRIAILGPGNVGRALASRAAQSGHEIIIGTRDPEGASARDAQLALDGAPLYSLAEAADRADLALLTVPWSAAEAVVRSLRGGTVVDCTNPVAAGLRHAIGDGSGAELLAAANPAVRVVKAFNVYGVEVLADPAFGSERPALPVAGDEAAAKAAVLELANSMGWVALDVGPLPMALHLEHLALLWIHMVRAQGRPPLFAWGQLVRPESHSARSAIKEVVHPIHLHGEAPRGRILMIAANPSVSEQTGWPIGCWAAELTHPYLEFVQAGYEVTIASPNGGALEFDGYSDPRHESGYSASDLVSMGFINTPSLMELTRNTVPLSGIDAGEFDAVFLVGGQSPMYTFRGNCGLMDFFAAFYESGKPAAAVCHATAILLDTKTSDGRLLVEGRTWTGFADEEERYADSFVGRKIQPFWIEKEARRIEGTTFRAEPMFTPHAIRDGNLITGQQQNSGAAAARLVLEALAERV